jgi:siroheme synthase
LSGATPAAVVHAAGRPGTRVSATDLAGVGTTRLPPPATMVIGPMVGDDDAHP